MDYKSIRWRLGLSQAEWAQKLGFELEEWSLIEDGKKPLSPAWRQKLVEWLIQNEAPCEMIEELILAQESR